MSTLKENIFSAQAVKNESEAIFFAQQIQGIQSSVDLKKNVSSFDIGFAALNTAGSGVSLLLGTAIPSKAIIVRSYFNVVSAFTDNGTLTDANTSTIAMGLEDQDDDVLVAAAVGTGFTTGLKEGIQLGTMASSIKLSAARQLAVKWTIAGNVTALTAGAARVFVEWVQGN
jgi:hypothetical protein